MTTEVMMGSSLAVVVCAGRVEVAIAEKNEIRQAECNCSEYIRNFWVLIAVGKYTVEVMVSGMSLAWIWPQQSRDPDHRPAYLRQEVVCLKQLGLLLQGLLIPKPVAHADVAKADADFVRCHLLEEAVATGEAYASEGLKDT
ncbi:D-tyrosyl-tRNA(Tyr) deacylase [Striga asiatica]|uniref:D-tyrosyl-tRNA(Tyr) deacylase n=1 Tax=Striga asiatica TaxID=4170 RepID=A0A5A7PJX8_STRAF|nr:D-tyrosyl-tRNA(Tyr) deacylase [Striga asiatica]